MKKILVITMLYPSSDNPAFGVFIQREVASLDRYFVQTVIVPKPWRPSEGITSLIEYDAKRASQTTNVEIIYKAYFPLPGTFFLPFKGVWFFLFLIRMVKRMQINFNFDIIHAHNVYPEGFCAILLKKIFNKPVMVTSRGNDLNNYPRYTILQRMIRYVLRNADGVITVSKSLAQRAIALGADPARVSVMRKGVDMEIFKPMRQKEARRKLDLPVDKIIILSIGWLIPRKNPFSFTKAMLNYTEEEREKLLFVWVGEGPLRPQVEKEIKERNLEAHILLAGRRPHEEIATWINAADIFMLVSFSEGMPNVLYETMACGVPVIASNVDGASEILEHMKTGILVSPNDYGGIARFILRLVNDNGLRHRLGLMGRDYVLEKRLDWETNALWIVDKYQHVLNHFNGAK